MSHASSWGGRDAGNECCHWLVGSVVGLQPFRRILFGNSADLTDEDDALGLGVRDELLEAINEIGAVEGVAADAHASALTEACRCGLMHGLVSQGARSADNANLARGVDVARHDAHFALTRLDDAGAIGADEAALILPHEGVLDLHHVLLRDALGDANNQWDFGLQRLENRSSSRGRGDVDDSGVAVSLLLGLCGVLENRQVQVHRAGLLGVDSTNHLGAVLDCLGGVEGALLAGHSLADDLGVLVHPNRGGGRHALRSGNDAAAGGECAKSFLQRQHRVAASEGRKKLNLNLSVGESHRTYSESCGL
mmetsp:Transcript_1043/g.2215  ORF Transcript_1043/g.2215 Transcript_1043/m.2215 type:complete len:308 (-) Transcript_1043:14-937(-)